MQIQHELMNLNYVTVLIVNSKYICHRGILILHQDLYLGFPYSLLVLNIYDKVLEGNYFPQSSYFIHFTGTPIGTLIRTPPIGTLIGTHLRNSHILFCLLLKDSMASTIFSQIDHRL